MATANLLLHPVRMRIMQTLLGAEPLTTAQLRERLPDIAPATMYRHIAVLADAEVLEVVGEKRVRGTIERSYQVRQERALVGEDDRTTMTRDDHRQAVTAFSGTLLADFGRYLARDDADPAADGLVYRQGAAWLTSEEFAELVEEFERAVTTRAASTPDDGRTRHIVSFAVVPDTPGKASREVPGANADTDQATD
ncbi:helix-turn-helix protein [Murinocardiopsis flavida]|uniref:Helix-turn-helix protein n=1 Tax=Murinocardiopsis flavida TaxID=645275 RepID=A0A2P8DE69_9ACTN|nr:helix-turn-helix domain-containing protein [Murinocardiopsis flavida]PSK95457.1 helix-turn-helix protein [Murinocardiopsis flavida]